MGLFSRKPKDEESSASVDTSEEGASPKPAAKSEELSSGDMSLTKLSSELIKIKASIEAFGEVRKSFTERFSRVSEQIGELRSMVLERDKTMQELELKAVKAYDLVDSVHPEKISTMVQRESAKIEALKANLEGNEAIMSQVMDEVKETRRKIEFFRGIEEVIKLSEEVKKELIEIKKIETRVNVNTDKVETIYAEMRKKFQDLDAFDSEVKEARVAIEQNTKDVTFLKDKIVGLAEKSELERLITKVQRYVDALKEVQKKSSMTKDIDQLRTLLESLR